MEKIKLNKDMTIFECNFKKGQEVSINGDTLMIRYSSGNINREIPVICDTFDKTPCQFMEELIKNN